MVSQPIQGYFMPWDEGILFIVHLWIYSLYWCSWEIFAQLHDIKISYLIQIIYTQLYDFMYSHLI